MTPQELSDAMLDHALSVAWHEDPVYLAFRAGVIAGLCSPEESRQHTLDSHLREYEGEHWRTETQAQ